MRMLQSLLGDKDGSALVEGAVLVPLLFVLLFGVYEFSWFFYQQHLVSTGIRDAARYLARVIDSCNAFSPAWAVKPRCCAGAWLVPRSANSVGDCQRVALGSSGG